MQHLVLLGGGLAHAHVLNRWAKAIPGPTQVTLVSPSARHIRLGMLPGWLTGQHALEDCAIALAPLAEAAGAGFIEAAPVAIDAQRREVRLSSGDVLGYDRLSLDLDPVMDRDGVAGAREHALFLRPVEHFVRLSDGLLSLAESRSLNVAVIGGGTSGVELSLALKQRLGDLVSLSLVTGGAAPLDGHSAGMQARAMGALRRARIAVLQERCIEITASQVVLANGARLACDAPLAAWEPVAQPWLADSGLALDAGGHVQTGATLQSTSHPEVFAVGDAARRIDAPQLQSGEPAEHSGPRLEENLRRSIAGRPLKSHAPHNPNRSLGLLACGGRHALGGWGRWSFEGEWVWHLKRWLDRRSARLTVQVSPGAARP